MKKIISRAKEQFSFIIFLSWIFTSLITISQKGYSQNPLLCGGYTIDTTAMQAAKTYELAHANSPMTTAYTIRVYFHICRDDNGSNAAATEAQIKSEFNTLILSYQANNICFINMGTNYINSTAINQMTVSNSSLLTPYLIPNCINYFYQQQVFGKGGSAYAIPNTFCSIASGNIGQGQTISHETGHCFGLLHTFEPANGYENINGSNSSNAGDQITDTPADPYAYNGQGCFTTSSCCYTGTCTDPNGQTNFNPPYNNLMAYWWIYGYTNLVSTLTQFARVNTYLGSNPSLQACESASSLTYGPITYSSGYHMSSAINTLTSNGTVLLNGTTVTSLGGNLVDLQPGFHADATSGALILIRPSYCVPVVPRISSLAENASLAVSVGDIICYPNPFNSNFDLSFNLKEDEKGRIVLYNTIGIKVKELAEKSLSKGFNKISINCSDLASGVYLIEINLGGIKTVKKIVKN